ncbi:MAG TPA: tetratricopeptide repeat protein [Thermoanaerobaculia bacterium]
MRKHRVLWILGLLLLAGAGVSAALYLTNKRDLTTSSKAAYDAYREAELNLKRFYFKEARVGYAKALELDPNFAMAMLGMAQLSPERDQRIALIRRAARERDHLTERERYIVDMAKADADGKPEVSHELARQLHARYPGDSIGAGALARDAMGKGKPDEAVKYYQDLLAVDPNNAEAYNQIGYQYGYRGEIDKAIENLKKYQFISPDNANPFDSLGENEAYSGRYNEAIENLSRALAIKPDFQPAYMHLGVAYEGMGDYAKAIESYRKCAAMGDTPEGDRRDSLLSAVRAAMINGDRDEVRRLLEEVGKIPADPKTDFGKIGPGYLAALSDLNDGHPAEAERRLKELRPRIDALWQDSYKNGKVLPGRKEHNPQWNYLMARALELQGKTDEALALYQLNADPPNPFFDFQDRRWIMEGRAKVAEIVARRGELDKAEKLIAENRKWNPSWAPCRHSEESVAEMRRAKVLAASK